MTDRLDIAKCKGKRALLRNGDGNIKEIRIEEVSPSGAYIKVDNEWKEAASVGIVEILDGKTNVKTAEPHRTNAEKQAAADALLKETPGLSVTEYAAKANVSESLVRRRAAKLGVKFGRHDGKAITAVPEAPTGVGTEAPAIP